MLKIEINDNALDGVGTSYLIYNEIGCYIVDPGRISFEVPSEVKGIILTHCHIDHMLYARNIANYYNVPIIAHKADKLLALSFPIQAQFYFQGQKPKNIINKPLHINQYVEDGDILKLGDDEIHVMHTPGHSPGSIMLYMPSISSVVSGDNIFQGGGVGRTDFPFSNPKDFEKPIARILELPHDTLVYPGHIYEPSPYYMFTIGDWKKDEQIQ